MPIRVVQAKSCASSSLNRSAAGAGSRTAAVLTVPLPETVNLVVPKNP